VLADGRYATYKLDELKSLPSVEIGLHFALSFSDQETSSDAFRSGRNFLRYYFSPKISRQEKITQFQNEWHRQLEMLSSLGIKPAYVDGHHHIHAFPLVAKALVAASKPLRVRIPYDPSLWLSKKAPINLLSLLSSRIFRMAGWSSAPFVYPNFETVKNPFKLGSLLKTMPDSSEIIFHPSAKDDLEDIGSQDTYRSQRCVEYHGLTQLPTVLGYLKI
jgi:predicted glycoside hydrolase/deacetylase ChbG (UPF0249 family)